MKIIPLTRGMQMLVDDDFPFMDVKWHASKSTHTHYYAKGTIDGKQQLAHRVLMGASRGVLVDHINGNTLDNRLENLRFASPSENASNRTRSSNKTGHMYVFTTSGGRFASAFTIGGKRIYVGSFDTPEQAHEAAVRAHGFETHFIVGRMWNESVEDALRRELEEIERARVGRAA